ncbi:DUF1566 domain-containing protein [Veronia pacifica]|uniref:Lcl C-terminal domain-containing protein n=1 Tax=Veronia pacifica TaxID=1080227 RepID=A0A1C3ER44_9GAMM|nr:DUF1566 domain-containing protein [Veronia pacifica]ODA35721.1 hypothetical protein A8L45_03695 [Veronia pacifica]
MKHRYLFLMITAALLTGCFDNTSYTSTDSETKTDESKDKEDGGKDKDKDEDEDKEGSDGTKPEQVVRLSPSDINILDTHKVSFAVPGMQAGTAQALADITANFGDVSVDSKLGVMTLDASPKGTQNDTASISTSKKASNANYQFTIAYSIDKQRYKVSGYAVPYFKDDNEQLVKRFTKMNEDGSLLEGDEQYLSANDQPWACIQDASTDLIWQVPSVAGEFAYDATYYWGDRIVNHRDFTQAACGLAKDCNSDNLKAYANQIALCGNSDWRLPTSAEWKTILDNKMFDDKKRQPPIDLAFFPYVDANYDEAYWTNRFTQYPDGHDAKGSSDDWQGSNALVGDAHVMWMSSDFDDIRIPPRSTNEPHFTLLVRGKTIADKSDNTKDGITETLENEVNKDSDEDENWTARFIKIGSYGQALRDQQVAEWSCTSDTFYRADMPNTQILWQRLDNDQPMSFSDAEQYVKDINANTLCGRNDWRLPNENELKSLLINRVSYGIPDTLGAGYRSSVLDDTVVEYDSYYWTSTPSSYYPDTKHMAVAFQTEFSESSAVANEKTARVRLISTSSIQP